MHAYSVAQTEESLGQWLEREACFSNDLDVVCTRLEEVAHKTNLHVSTLGHRDGNPILFLHSTPQNGKPTALVAAGFHGDEPAGIWGIVRFLERQPVQLLSQINISFLPVVNPTGFRRNRRTNAEGKDPNRGFIELNSDPIDLSQEGEILMRHFDTLRESATDGFISLHEDYEMKDFYIYTFETSTSPGWFSDVLVQAGLKYFAPYPDGIVEGASIRNGIVYGYADGSFEDLLFRCGVPRTASTETPGLLDIDKRIEANAEIISAFARSLIAYGSKP